MNALANKPSRRAFVAGAVAEKAEIEVLAQRVKVHDEVSDKERDERHEKDQGDHLDGDPPVPGVIKKLARPEGASRRLSGNGHARRSHPVDRRSDEAEAPEGASVD